VNGKIEPLKLVNSFMSDNVFSKIKLYVPSDGSSKGQAGVMASLRFPLYTILGAI